MENARFEPVTDILKKQMFLPFELSIRELLNVLHNINRDIVNEDDWVTVNGQHIEVGEGGEIVSGTPKVFGENGKEGVEKSSNSGNMATKNSGSEKTSSKKESLPMTDVEKAKVGHDINNRWHTIYKGKRSCFIATSSNETDSPTYLYRFRNHGFDNYDIYRKESTDDEEEVL